MLEVDFAAEAVAQARAKVQVLPPELVGRLTFQVADTLRLLDVVEGHRRAALYRLAVNLGMRQAELFGLTWPAIDFAQGTLRINQQLRRARPEA